MSNTPRIERQDKYQSVCKSCGRTLMPIEVTYEETHDGCGGIAVPIETELISKLEHDAIVDQRGRDIAELVEALTWFIDDDPCMFDHYGCCQTHNQIERGCAVADARNLIAKHRKEVSNG